MKAYFLLLMYLLNANTKPAAGVRINWVNPLTNNLRYAIALREGSGGYITDDVCGRRGQLFSSAATEGVFVTDKYGKALHCVTTGTDAAAGANFSYNNSSGDSGLWMPQQDMSIFHLVYYSSVVHDPTFIRLTGSRQDGIHTAGTVNGSDGLLSFVFSGIAAIQPSPSYTLTGGHYYILGFSYHRAQQKVDFFVKDVTTNAVFISNGVATGGNPGVITGTPTCLGSYNTTTAGASLCGNIFSTFLWARALDTTEWQMLAANPWQLYANSAAAKYYASSLVVISSYANSAEYDKLFLQDANALLQYARAAEPESNIAKNSLVLSARTNANENETAKSQFVLGLLRYAAANESDTISAKDLAGVQIFALINEADADSVQSVRAILARTASSEIDTSLAQDSRAILSRSNAEEYEDLSARDFIVLSAKTNASENDSLAGKDVFVISARASATEIESMRALDFYGIIIYAHADIGEIDAGALTPFRIILANAESAEPDSAAGKAARIISACASFTEEYGSAVKDFIILSARATAAVIESLANRDFSGVIIYAHASTGDLDTGALKDSVVVPIVAHGNTGDVESGAAKILRAILAGAALEERESLATKTYRIVSAKAAATEVDNLSGTDAILIYARAQSAETDTSRAWTFIRVPLRLLAPNMRITGGAVQVNDSSPFNLIVAKEYTMTSLTGTITPIAIHADNSIHIIAVRTTLG